MSQTDDLLDSCSLVSPRVKGECSWCHRPLKGKQRQWCSKTCSGEFVRNHSWTSARSWALKIANNACMVCGEKASIRWDTKWGRSTLEVNHIVPVVGRRKSYDCQNHQDNLQVVCCACHGQITKEQRQAGLFKKTLTP